MASTIVPPLPRSSTNMIEKDHDPLVETLFDHEKWWRDKYHWFSAKGYQLRSRYHPNWRPSFTKSDLRFFHEDGKPMPRAGVNHAIRDGKWVVLKRIDTIKFPRELDLMIDLMRDPLASDPRNRCIRLVDLFVIPDNPDTWIVVMPLLRRFDSPPFETVGEVLDFVLQISETLQFLHENGIIHGDLSLSNIMMDASDMYPKGWHPMNPDWMKADFRFGLKHKFTRTERPPTYHIIDFGISKRFREGERLRVTADIGTDFSAPEYSNPALDLNPFWIDVYCLGNLLRQEFMDGDGVTLSEGYYHFEFLRPLINDMTNPEPKMRPTMDVVVSRIKEIMQTMSSRALRKRAVPRGESDFPEWYLKSRHLYKTISLVLRRLPAIPGAR